MLFRSASLGALVALFERAVGLYGELIDINAYHQPGVEAGKKAAASLLDLQAKVVAHLKHVGEPQTAEQVAKALGIPDRTESVYKLLEHLAANTGRGVDWVDGSDPMTTTFREVIRE